MSTLLLALELSAAVLCWYVFRYARAPRHPIAQLLFLTLLPLVLGIWAALSGVFDLVELVRGG